MFGAYKRIIVVLSLILLILLAACNGSNESSGSTSNEPGAAGDGAEDATSALNIAMGAQPPNLDPHMSATIATRDVGKQIYETLITVDEEYNQVPMLAESVQQSEDGKTYTFNLREGIMFHNGKEMTSEDVVASMERWLEYNDSAQMFLDEAEFKAEDTYKVTLEVATPSIFILATLGTTTQIPAIMPKEVVDSTPESGVTEHIGTGPFKFEEWKQDQYIHLSKYEDYQSLDSEPNGLSGKKEVFIKDVYFQIVPDTSTQVSGLQTGQYNLLLEAPNDNYQMMLDDPSIETTINDYGPYSLIFNKNAGVFQDVDMRQAVNAGIDFTEILETSFVHEHIYEVDSSYVSTKNEKWYSDEGKEYYNQNDPEKAKKMLAEAGYDGEEVKILTTRDYPHIYNTGVVLEQQLDNLGINVSLEVYDWATAISTRNNEPEEWDFFITGDQFFITPIENYVYTHDQYRDLNNSKLDGLISDIKNAESEEDAKVMWDKLQQYSWENLPLIKVGNFNKVSALNSNVIGYRYLDGPILWGTKIEK
ncbi:peptide/nickel transport system substrate-binding protein [Lentibacillus persicus]|uniref:Peptide/nickel transport system substrate-binding protein n=1 Tax=Lentibacillus persicus TaxID=640948 RepID=A0A1I1VYA3_9BACI|nr:ABC transporter substrate-binding protein [Lentibacillus persicus]SFD87835.1 peptide/nickel transport system substrate-binding protein [Lentibacillus persicus]